MGFRTKLLGVVSFCALVGSALLYCQAAPTGSSEAAGREPYPEQGKLSNSRYLNQYFKFEFDFPPDLHLQPLPQPDARDGSIQLLELAGPPPVDAEIAIAAIPMGTEKYQDAKAYLRFALDQELFRGVEELRGLSKGNFGGHQFYLFETRRGIEQHMLLATTLDGYIVRVVLAAHDEKTVKQLATSFENLVFFSAADLQQYLKADAQPYDGPAVSSHRLASLEADPPAARIDPGVIRGDFYENPSIGFSYRIPQGWTLEAEGAIQPAVERDRAKQDFGRPRIGAMERRLMQACSRTLFSAWAKRPGADGQISYDEFGEVTVSAISMACFPRMKFPESATDRQQFKDFLLEFGLTHPILNDIRDGKVFTAGGNVFLFLHGTVGFEIPNDELARRLSIAMAVTARRGYILTWFFAAPHDSELQALTDERVSFDSGPPVTVVNAAKAGPGAPAAEAEEKAAASDPSTLPGNTGGAGSSTKAGAPGPNAEANGSTAPSAAAGDQPAKAADPANANRPSLLRPGETMQSQQGKGEPINKQRQSD